MRLRLTTGLPIDQINGACPGVLWFLRRLTLITLEKCVGIVYVPKYSHLLYYRPRAQVQVAINYVNENKRIESNNLIIWRKVK